jgi:predicted 2-oxoglutarate/Fe(II)-dependent dioxygenase YbiX
MEMLQDYIRVFDSVVPQGLCDALLDEFVNSEEWVDTAVGPSHLGAIDKSVRSASAIGMSHQETIQKNQEVRSKLDARLFNAVSNVIQQYSSVCPYAGVSKDSGYELLRYRTGEFYIQHVDSTINHNRSISCSLILNDGYEGGEFAFFDRKVVLSPSKGAALLFPSNFMFPHEIMPVLSGTRYSVVTWFV